MTTQVFLSYRRRVSWQSARLVYGALTDRYIDVFMDTADISSGLFEGRIVDAIRSRRNFVLLVERGSLEHIAAEGDWLRREIALALSSIGPDRVIVPLVFDDLVLADHLLPPDIASLAGYNPVPVYSSYFDAAMHLLCDKFLKPDPPPPAEDPSRRAMIKTASPPVVEAWPRTAGPQRFAQLTYTSFKDGAREGWHVKNASGVTAAEESVLVQGVSTKFDQYPPRHLSATQIDKLPRRLAYGPLFLDGAVAYWHTVPAGYEPGGRPWNVFAHVLLDRDPAATQPLLRPSDLLDSPDWLRPFGADEVLATVIDDVPVPLRASGSLTRAAVLEFLAWASKHRAGTLAALLDGLAAAMHGQLPVVLGTDDPLHARLWIASACHLMSPGTSRELYWSTAERADDVAGARLAGLHLAVVPLADLSLIGRKEANCVLLSDEDGAVHLGDLYIDAHHYTRHGSRIRVTPWSVIVAAVLRNRDVATRALELQDEIASAVGDRRLECAWPLAMAVIGMSVELDKLFPVIALALATSVPAGLAPGGRLDRLRALMRRQHAPRPWS